MFKIISALLLVFSFFTCFAQKKQQKVLVFTKTAGYHHQSIPAGVAALLQLGATNGYGVDTTTNSNAFTDANLKQYAALVFMSTTGNVFDTLQKEALVRYIHAGGGFMGIHSATNTEPNWPWFVQMQGACFSNHPKPQMATVLVTDSVHPATQHLPRPWRHQDEWYNFKAAPTNVHVLLSADETSYEGGKMGAAHPLAWYHKFEGGRVFYTSLGHFDDAYSEPLFLEHLEKGIEWAMGKK